MSAVFKEKVQESLPVFSYLWHESNIFILCNLDNQCTPKSGSPVNHKSPSSALSTVLHSIPSGRKQKKIPAALKEVSALLIKSHALLVL